MSPSSSRPPDPGAALWQSWLQLWRQSAIWGPGGLVMVACWLEARQLQRRWFGDLARATDQSLKSSALLALAQNAVTVTGGGHPPPPPPR
jgi:hypothetical protein